MAYTLIWSPLARDDLRVLKLRRAGRVLRRFSVSEIGKWPTDEAGYSVIKVGD